MPDRSDTDVLHLAPVDTRDAAFVDYQRWLTQSIAEVFSGRAPSIPNHSPEGLSRSPSDDEGPGAPVAQHDVLPDVCAAASLPGAPAPDPKRLNDAEAIAAYILQYSGAC